MNSSLFARLPKLEYIELSIYMISYNYLKVIYGPPWQNSNSSNMCIAYRYATTQNMSDHQLDVHPGSHGIPYIEFPAGE